MKNTNPFDNDDDDDDDFVHVPPPSPYSPSFLKSMQQKEDEGGSDKPPSPPHDAPSSSLPSSLSSSSEPPRMMIDPSKIEYVVFDEDVSGPLLPVPSSTTETRTSHHDAPSPYSPDFIKHVASSSDSMSSSATATNHNKNSFSTRSFDSIPPASNNTFSQHQQSQQQHRFRPDEPGTASPASSSARYSINNVVSSWTIALTKVKRATVAGVSKVKQYEQNHQLRQRTKSAAVHSYESMKSVTVQAATKTKEWNEQHQVTARTKQQFKRSASFVKGAIVNNKTSFSRRHRQRDVNGSNSNNI
eukprot:CAMPEP_0119003350 /NCGR_PEP_ID=MMETSP1176-20130426/511_1 /TAXON_ID=265551 /ORGANISM="Synedropsis recta cf, Strain CCMP1620" /LENGTH=300 /DNA_ID=CAMNT_0006954945 /DNA_START=112 /DNA_END=1011 /DNA_ORIENTATION=+